MLRDGIEITCSDLTSVKVVYAVVSVNILITRNVIYDFRMYSYLRELIL